MARKLKPRWTLWALLGAVLGLWLLLTPPVGERRPAGESPPPAAPLVAQFIDVGQGEAILLSQGGSYMLVDAGPDRAGKTLVRFLKEQGVTHLDYLLLTHGHEDHIGRVPEVLALAPADTVYLPAAVHTTVAYEDMLDAVEASQARVVIAQAGDSFTLGQATVDIVGPVREYPDLNDNSLVLRVSYGGASLLLTGDAEAAAEADILAAGDDISAALLKVAHHGSDSSTGEEWLEAVSPRLAVISCGADNEYAHPHPEVLARLRAVGAAIYRTDLCGTVTAVSSGDGFIVYTEK